MIGYGTVTGVEPGWQHTDYHAFLRRPVGSDRDDEVPLGEDLRWPGVPLGRVTVEAVEPHWGADGRVSVAFSLPDDLEPGLYAVDVCTAGCGAPLGWFRPSDLHVGVDPAFPVLRNWPLTDPAIRWLEDEALLGTAGGSVTAADVRAGRVPEPAVTPGPPPTNPASPRPTAEAPAAAAGERDASAVSATAAERSDADPGAEQATGRPGGTRPASRRRSPPGCSRSFATPAATSCGLAGGATAWPRPCAPPPWRRSGRRRLGSRSMPPSRRRTPVAGVRRRARSRPGRATRHRSRRPGGARRPPGASGARTRRWPGVGPSRGASRSPPPPRSLSTWSTPSTASPCPPPPRRSASARSPAAAPSVSRSPPPRSPRWWTGCRRRSRWGPCIRPTGRSSGSTISTSCRWRWSCGRRRPRPHPVGGNHRRRLGIVGRSVPDGWEEAATADLAAADRAVAGLLAARGLDGFGEPAVRVGARDGAVTTTQVYADPGQQAFTLTQSPGGLLPPPSSGDETGVDVRGTPGRYSQRGGEVEWLEDGLTLSLRSDTLTIGDLLATSELLEPAA